MTYLGKRKVVGTKVSRYAFYDVLLNLEKRKKN